MTKVAIIGTGFWGAKLAEGVHRSSLELAACYSRDAEKRRAFAERFGGDAAGSYEAALEAADAVLLATPNGEHEEQTLAAIVVAIGFSTKMCLPRLAAVTVCSSWPSFGVASTTTSAASSAASYEAAGSQPKRSANAARFSGSRE